MCRLVGSGSDNPTDTFRNEEAGAKGDQLPTNDAVSRLEEQQFGDAGLRWGTGIIASVTPPR